MIAALVVITLATSASSLNVKAGAKTTSQSSVALGATTSMQASGVFKEMERRCLAGDVDGATQAALLWFKPKGAKMTKAKFIRLLDVCLKKNGMLGEGDNCALGKQEHCDWANDCIETSDCSNPPLKEIMLTLKAHTEESGKPFPTKNKQPEWEALAEKEWEALAEKLKATATQWKMLPSSFVEMQGKPNKELKVEDFIYWLKTLPSLVFPPGTYVARCPACNMAMNMAWWSMEDGKVLEDMPFYSSIDRIFWDMIMPYVIKNKPPTEKELWEQINGANKRVNNYVVPKTKQWVDYVTPDLKAPEGTGIYVPDKKQRVNEITKALAPAITLPTDLNKHTAKNNMEMAQRTQEYGQELGRWTTNAVNRIAGIPFVEEPEPMEAPKVKTPPMPPYPEGVPTPTLIPKPVAEAAETMGDIHDEMTHVMEWAHDNKKTLKKIR